ETGIGLPAALSATVLATMAVLFAATTLDTVVRLMRYVVQEIAGNMNIRLSKIPATVVVLVLGGGLTFSQGMSGEGGMRIWPLFGTTNQLLAALTLIVIAVVLIRKRRNPWPALIPLAFVFVLSFWAAIEQLVSFADPAGPDWLLLAIDIVIIGSSILVSIEGIASMRRAAKEPPESDRADAELTEQQKCTPAPPESAPAPAITSAIRVGACEQSRSPPQVNPKFCRSPMSRRPTSPPTRSSSASMPQASIGLICCSARASTIPRPEPRRSPASRSPA